MVRKKTIQTLKLRRLPFSYHLISQLDTLITLENGVIMLMSNRKFDPNISSMLRLILDSSMRILECSRDIAEVTLNRTVEEITAIQTS